MPNCDAPSLSRYKGAARCRCDGCRAANIAYMREYHKARIISGRRAMVPADRAREHLRRLRELGIGYKRAAELAGLSVSAMHTWRIANGRTQMVRRTTETALARRETLAIPQDVRDAVDERDRLHCRVCGKWLGDRRALHHVIYGGDARGMGGRRVHNVDEIVTVCWLPGDPKPGVQPCHERVHSNKHLWQPLLLEVARRRGITALQLRRWRVTRERRSSER
jgi:hypothetical protein